MVAIGDTRLRMGRPDNPGRITAAPIVGLAKEQGSHPGVGQAQERTRKRPGAGHDPVVEHRRRRADQNRTFKIGSLIVLKLGEMGCSPYLDLSMPDEMSSQLVPKIQQGCADIRIAAYWTSSKGEGSRPRPTQLPAQTSLAPSRKEGSTASKTHNTWVHLVDGLSEGTNLALGHSVTRTADCGSAERIKGAASRTACFLNAADQVTRPLRPVSRRSPLIRERPHAPPLCFQRSSVWHHSARSGQLAGTVVPCRAGCLATCHLTAPRFQQRQPMRMRHEQMPKWIPTEPTFTTS